MPIILVYGTLKRSEVNYPFWMNDGAAEFLGAARTVDKYPLFVASAEFAGSPCLMDLPGEGHRVCGDVFRVTDERLAELAILEGIAKGVYVSKTIPCALENGATVDGKNVVEASVYFRNTRFQEDWRTTAQLFESYSRFTTPVPYVVPHLRPATTIPTTPVTPKPIVLVILDGVGDVACAELDGKTPLQYAKTPSLDRVAATGVSGLMDSVEAGLACGSDTAHLSMFGYDPRKYYRGRGAFEAIGAGMSMQIGDIAFKSNFACWDEATNVVTHRRCDRNFEAEGPILSEALNDTVVEGFPEHRIFVRYATEHRCGVVVRGPNLSDQISGTDPLRDELPLVECAPTASADTDEARAAAAFTSKVIMAVHRTISARLTDHPINRERVAAGKRAANIVLLRGAAMQGAFPGFLQQQGLPAVAVAPTCIIAGLCKSVGIDVVPSPGGTGDYHSDLVTKADTLCAQLASGKYHFGILHIKGVDDAGHDHNLGVKVGMLERSSDAVHRLMELLPDGATVAVTADHSTDCYVGDHSCEPVPFAITKKGGHPQGAADAVHTFDELAAAHGLLGRFEGKHMMEVIRGFHLGL